MPERRALLVGVSAFAGPEDGAVSDLDFAGPAVEELATVLRDEFGFSVTTVTQPGLTGSQLGSAVQSALDAAGTDAVLIVHLLTHGASVDQHLYALGSDSIIDRSTEIGHWLASLQHAQARPCVLFTLDLCNSGIVTTLPWQARYDRGARVGWVIAACEPDMDAFNGHFTRALTSVLRDIADGSLEVDAALEHIPLETVARAVRRTVTQLAEVAGTYQQYVTASSVDVSVDPPLLPLFVNPSHSESREDLRGTPDRPSQRFLDDLDEALDARHFIERAAGSSAVYDVAENLTGWFTGRPQELQYLSRWLNDTAGQPLALVTGSPGSGKSALLGMLTCAAHLRLRDNTRNIWSRGAHAPAPVDYLAVVHAQQRDITAISRALGRQLGLGEELAPDEFLAQIQVVHDQRPVLIIDALDEAGDPAIVAEWLARLATLTRPDGSPAVRLLVASRAYPESEPLRLLAQGSVGREFDLDDVSDDELINDIYRYVTDLLRVVPAYREAHMVTGEFAGKLAEAVVGSRSQGWGEFLVAGMYARHFIATFRTSEGPAAAGRLGSAIPQTLPDVLEMDLAHRRDDPWLRPVLTLLAHARGHGMPASVIFRVASSFRANASAPSHQEVRSALEAGRFYLRQSTDSDRVTVYRLFHEGLADYLRGSSDGSAVSEPLLAGIGPPDRRVWAAAEPYLLQHALDHVGDSDELISDPGFLLYADRSAYLPLLDQQTRRLVDGWVAEQEFAVKRANFARIAAADGRHDLARRIADLPGEPPLTWLPVWVRGKPDVAHLSSPEPVVAALDDRGRLRRWNWGPARTSQVTQPTALAFGRLDGRLVLATGEQDGTVRVAGPDDVPLVVARNPAAVTAMAVAEHRAGCLVLTGTEDRVVAMHLVTGTSASEFRPPVSVPGGPAKMIATGGDPLTPVVACVNGSGQLYAWQVGAAENSAIRPWEHTSPVRSAAVCSLSGRPVIVFVCSDGVARTWDYAMRTPRREFGGPEEMIRVLAISSADGRTVAVTGGQDGSIRMWDLLTGRLHGQPLSVCPGPVRAIAVRNAAWGLLCLVVAGDRTVLWDLVRRRPIREFDLHGATSVALDLSGTTLRPPEPTDGPTRLTALQLTAGDGGQPLALIGDEHGSTELLDLRSARPSRAALPGDGRSVTSIEIAYLAGQPSALIQTDTLTTVWQLRTGDSVTIPAEQGSGAATRSWGNQVIVGGNLLQVTTGGDGVILLNDDFLGRHEDSVTAITTAYLDDRPVAITGDMSGCVRIWDLGDRELGSELAVEGSVFAISATLDGWLLVGAGGCVYAFQHLTAR